MFGSRLVPPGHVFHHLLVILGCTRDCRLVLLWRQSRQLLKERNHIPDQIVAVRLAPRGHGSELHAMLDDPELLRGRLIGVVREPWCWRIETLAHLTRFRSRSEV